jgi:hypothetical protein
MALAPLRVAAVESTRVHGRARRAAPLPTSMTEMQQSQRAPGRLDSDDVS